MTPLRKKLPMSDGNAGDHDHRDRLPHRARVRLDLGERLHVRLHRPNHSPLQIGHASLRAPS